MAESESRDALVRELEELKSTRDKVLELPRKIRRPVMVPLSKVAFLAGDLVHTNEFCIGKAGIDDPDAWMSHVDAAAELQARIDAIDAQLRGASFPAPSPSLVPTHLPAPAPTQKPKPKTKPAPTAPLVMAKKEHEEETDGPVFEIREFIDEAGSLVQHQVVDLQRELEGLQRSLGEVGPEEGAESAAEPGAAGTKSQKRAEAQRVVADLESKLKGLKEPAGSDGSGRPDGDAAFVRELHDLATRREARLAASMEDGGEEEWHEDGEEEEDEEEVDLGFLEQLAAEEDRAREARERARDEISEAGWGRGFLGGGSKAGNKAGSKASLGPAKTQDKQQEGAAEAAPLPTPAPKPAPRPVAFGAAIFEKGFP